MQFRPVAVPVLEAGIDLKLGSFRQNGSWPLAVPFGGRDRPEIGFVPSKRQLAGCRSCFFLSRDQRERDLEAGIDLKLGSFRQNGSWPLAVRVFF